LRVFVLGSGSSGNCIVVEAEGERVVIDAGINPTRATEKMRALGGDLITPRAPLGLVVTHDHGDHSAHALPLARALRVPVWTHDRAALERTRRRAEVKAFVPGRPIPLGPFVIETLVIPHDAAQVAVRVSAGSRRFGIATDLGHPTRELHGFLAECDLAFVEANYCPRMLEVGPYPLRLRRRVAGPLGHLANEQAAAVARSLENTRVARVVLVHLSRANNVPQRALDVVASAAHRVPIEVVPHGEPRAFEVLGARAWAATAAHGQQLTLGF
jgi:phosphoribosyl 1,2-cyclic phosphodiesterase